MPLAAPDSAPKAGRAFVRPLWAEREKPHSDLAYARLPIRPGDRVLDIGCGHGQTTFELLDRVGANGAVVGLETDRGAVEVARAEQLAAQVDNVAFLVGDLASVSLPRASFDVAVSRFGIDLDPRALPLLSQVRQALCPGGVLGMLCWRGLRHNPWWNEPSRLAARVLGAGRPLGHGGFAQAECTPLLHRALLRSAGFENVRHQRIEPALCLGRDLDHALAVVTGLLIGTRHTLDRDVSTLKREIRALLAARRRADGSVWLASSSWFIAARVPSVAPRSRARRR